MESHYGDFTEVNQPFIGLPGFRAESTAQNTHDTEMGQMHSYKTVTHMARMQAETYIKPLEWSPIRKW